MACTASLFSSAQSSPDFLQKTLMAYELYSWPDSKGGWNFSLRPNTDSEASEKQVFSRTSLLAGVKQLELAISAMPAGTHIYWLNRIPKRFDAREKGRERLTYPPMDIRDRVVHYAQKRHVEVEVLDKTL